MQCNTASPERSRAPRPASPHPMPRCLCASRRIHQCIDIKMLAERLGMDLEAAEK